MESTLKGFASGLTKMGTQSLEGILNIGLLGVSLIPFALALKTFAGVRFDKVLIGIGALGAIALIARVLGDPTISTFIFIGAAAIAALGLALIPFGFGLDFGCRCVRKIDSILDSPWRNFQNKFSCAITITKEVLDTIKSHDHNNRRYNTKYC